MASPALPVDDSARFRDDLQALTGVMPDHLGIAVSGGPDSMALLLLACATLPGRVHAATVNHGLRPSSACEADHVADLCKQIDCPHEILTVSVSDGPGGTQANARRARYQALFRWAKARDLRYLATAHHRDDQAETLLMRLKRGSGVGGLAGIRPIREEAGIVIIRPLLGWTKAELARQVAKSGIEAVDDPSNRDSRFARTAARNLLAEQPELDRAVIARSAAALREAEEALRWSTDRLWRERVSRSGDELMLAAEGLPAELQRRLVGRILGEFALVASSRGDEIGRLLARLSHGETATLAGVKCSGGAVWRFEAAPPRRR